MCGRDGPARPAPRAARGARRPAGSSRRPTRPPPSASRRRAAAVGSSGTAAVPGSGPSANPPAGTTPEPRSAWDPRRATAAAPLGPPCTSVTSPVTTRSTQVDGVTTRERGARPVGRARHVDGAVHDHRDAVVGAARPRRTAGTPRRSRRAARRRGGRACDPGAGRPRRRCGTGRAARPLRSSAVPGAKNTTLGNRASRPSPGSGARRRSSIVMAPLPARRFRSRPRRRSRAGGSTSGSRQRRITRPRRRESGRELGLAATGRRAGRAAAHQGSSP